MGHTLYSQGLEDTNTLWGRGHTTHSQRMGHDAPQTGFKGETHLAFPGTRGHWHFAFPERDQHRVRGSHTHPALTQEQDKGSRRLLVPKRRPGLWLTPGDRNVNRGWGWEEDTLRPGQRPLSRTAFARVFPCTHSSIAKAHVDTHTPQLEHKPEMRFLVRGLKKKKSGRETRKRHATAHREAVYGHAVLCAGV